MTNSATKPKREMKVLSLGLPRTGSASMAEALTILGYKNVYHATQAIDSPKDWAILERACDASFPNLPSYTGKPLTREDWDELWGHCEATTDVASFFAPQLIEMYPDAKVILAIRDYEPWFKSVDQTLLQSLWNPIAQFSISVVEPVLGSAIGRSVRKQLLGLFGAQTVEEARRNARETWERHHRVIREIVPEGQLLEYRMGQGWEPICEFLDKPVPEEEFPWVNEAAELKKVIAAKIKRNLAAAAVVLLPWVGAVSIVGAGVKETIVPSNTEGYNTNARSYNNESSDLNTSSYDSESSNYNTESSHFRNENNDGINNNNNYDNRSYNNNRNDNTSSGVYNAVTENNTQQREFGSSNNRNNASLESTSNQRHQNEGVRTGDKIKSMVEDIPGVPSSSTQDKPTFNTPSYQKDTQRRTSSHASADALPHSMKKHLG
ncbi:hypothetical protein FLONG3_5848 [Fusarium longipes]|uniref:Nad dependent epimerase dehydratase n=1 Tax=Fusarium longipes TaxID=694270 RepID=A0A395SRQ8_9HYPO|nr:hypothetical protein FLONG3_5848 [Fusarium longipes]